MALSRIGSAAIADGAIQGVDIQAGAVTNTAGMVFGLNTDGSTGALTVTRGVTNTTDGNGDQLYDVTIVGTDDMSFTVDDNGHLIMSIS